MAYRVLFASVAIVALFLSGMFLSRRTKSISPLRLESERSRFDIQPLADTAVLLDATTGHTWILERNSDDEEVAWLPLSMAAGDVSPVNLRWVSANDHSSALTRRPRFALRSLLEQRGYTRIKVKRRNSGILLVSAKFDSIDVSLVLDTGSPETRFDRKRSESLELSLPTVLLEPGTANAANSGARGLFGSLELGPFRTREFLIGACDLTEMNRRLAENYGEPPVDGVLGQDVFEAHLAIVDYMECDLFLLGRGVGE